MADPSSQNANQLSHDEKASRPRQETPRAHLSGVDVILGLDRPSGAQRNLIANISEVSMDLLSMYDAASFSPVPELMLSVQVQYPARQMYPENRDLQQLQRVNAEPQEIEPSGLEMVLGQNPPPGAQEMVLANLTTRDVEALSRVQGLSKFPILGQMMIDGSIRDSIWGGLACEEIINDEDARCGHGPSVGSEVKPCTLHSILEPDQDRPLVCRDHALRTLKPGDRATLMEWIRPLGWCTKFTCKYCQALIKYGSLNISEDACQCESELDQLLETWACSDCFQRVLDAMHFRSRINFEGVGEDGDGDRRICPCCGQRTHWEDIRPDQRFPQRGLSYDPGFTPRARPVIGPCWCISCLKLTPNSQGRQKRSNRAGENANQD
ncbi:MAG: hypothetical protein MMC23_006273 [Stictis urceolatum]|nr:hypothetical protein [Stictis urceolata]